MKCHQRKVREAMEQSETGDLFGRWWTTLDLRPEKAVVREIDYQTAASVILKYEWLGTMPSVFTTATGLFMDGALAGAVCLTHNKMGGRLTLCGRPAVCLSRGACTHWAPPWAASHLISQTVKLLTRAESWEFVLAYSDTEAGEIGTVYQAANWYCIGTRTARFWLSPGGVRRNPFFHRDLARGTRNRVIGRRVRGTDHHEASAQLLRIGWRLVSGSIRYRYAQALGTGRAYRERRRFLEQMAIPYPKRAVEVSRETRAQNQGEAAGSIPAHGSEETAA